MLPINLNLYLLFLLTGLTAAILPGPSILYVVSQSIYLGFKRSLPSIFGLISGSILFGMAIIWWHEALLQAFYKFQFPIKLLACGGLAFIGIKRSIACGKT